MSTLGTHCEAWGSRDERAGSPRRGDDVRSVSHRGSRGATLGAVRQILSDGHLVVDIENKGDVLIPEAAIVGVVEQKVLVDVRKLVSDERL